MVECGTRSRADDGDISASIRGDRLQVILNHMSADLPCSTRIKDKDGTAEVRINGRGKITVLAMVWVKINGEIKDVGKNKGVGRILDEDKARFLNGLDAYWNSSSKADDHQALMNCHIAGQMECHIAGRTNHRIVDRKNFHIADRINYRIEMTERIQI